jgi:hypothetical protein
MTWPPLIEFYLKNHEDINAVIELEKRARRDLPGKVGQLLRAALHNSMLADSWKGIENPSVRFWPDEDSVEWYDARFYNDKNEAGALFGIYPISKVNDTGNNELFIFLQFFMGKKRAKGPATSFQHFLGTIERVRHNVKIPEMHFGNPWEEGVEPNVLAYWPIDEILNLRELASSPAKVGREIADIAKKFTEAFAPEFSKVA